MEPIPDEFVGRCLGGAERPSAPAIPIDTIFLRWRRRTRHAAIAAGALLVAAAAVFALLRSRPVEPPVHLRLELVDVDTLRQEGALSPNGRLGGDAMEVP